MGVCLSKKDSIADEQREAEMAAQASAQREADDQAKRKTRRKKRSIEIQLQKPLMGKVTGHTVRGIDTVLELRTELHKVATEKPQIYPLKQHPP